MLRALNTVGLSDTEKAIVKATYDDEADPKAKHVECKSPFFCISCSFSLSPTNSDHIA